MKINNINMVGQIINNKYITNLVSDPFRRIVNIVPM